MQYAITAKQTTIDFTLNSKRLTLITLKKLINRIINESKLSIIHKHYWHKKSFQGMVCKGVELKLR